MATHAAPTFDAPDLAAPEPTGAELIAARPFLSMHAMDGLLVDDVPLNRVADEFGTPTWVYSAATMRARYRALTSALGAARLDAHVHYAMKANDHLAILRLFAREGAGVDVVSGGELLRARAAGIAGDQVVFSGVGKSPHELRLALSEDIAQINVESAEELAMLSAVAVEMGRTARVALRVNPDVDAGTHAKISTGRAQDKFGIPYAEAAALYAHAATLTGIRPIGLAVHIGSQILSLAPYRAAYARIAELVRALRAGGLTVETVDCGGGLGIPYRDEPAPSSTALAGAIAGALHNLGLHLTVEPGRWLVGPAGVLLASVILVKQTGIPVKQSGIVVNRPSGSRFIVLDAAMNDLVRPAMYDAWHGIVPVSAVEAAGAVSPAEIVGPVCESGDTFARGRMLPAVAANSRVAILDAGAYGSVMSSTYNARPLAAEVMIDGGDIALIRARQPVEALWAGESIPKSLR
jgi:diaminopimelate decarboxylase